MKETSNPPEPHAPSLKMFSFLHRSSEILWTCMQPLRCCFEPIGEEHSLLHAPSRQLCHLHLSSEADCFLCEEKKKFQSVDTVQSS